jgi:HD-GYP domain-containing protein (c-di-GMP phosphodiesterase class II)
MIKQKEITYFSILTTSVVTDQPLPFDVYINSSAQNEHFVKLVGSGATLTKDDIAHMKDKYMNIYLSEAHRNDYILSLNENNNITLIEKGELLKETAIQYLDEIFKVKEFSNEILSKSLDNCKVATLSMVKLIKDFSLNDLQELIGELSFHDFYTYDHSINVSMYNILQYKSIKQDASEDELVIAGLSGILHDLGKIQLSTSILNKTDKLTTKEVNEIKKHPQYGKQLFTNICCENHLELQDVIKVIYEHHENFDGSGYPNQLIGTNISLLARITAISDFYDAITTKRSYQDPLPTKAALLLMNQHVGKKLDPLLFKNFVNQISRLLNLNDQLGFDVMEDFDPCQPRKEINFIHKATVIKIKETKDEQIGKVTVIDTDPIDPYKKAS